MIKHLLSIACVSIGLNLSAQSFVATYSFAATTTLTGTTDPSVPPVATGVTFGSFTAVGTSSASTGAGRFSFTNWPTGATTAVDTYTSMTGALDPSKYYEVTLTPVSGYELTLSGITFGVRRSGTGIRSYAVRSSADTYGSNLTAAVGTNTNLSVVATDEFFWNFDATSTSSDQNGSAIILSGAPFTAVTTPVTFRFYAWNSEAGTGTFSIDNVTFAGSTSLATGLGKVNYDINAGFNVYPVPNHDGIVYIEGKNLDEVSKIEVMDVLGNIILTSASKNENKVRLNLSEVPEGNYFVRIYNGNSVSTKKFTIIK